jgi:hypothetical protein
VLVSVRVRAGAQPDCPISAGIATPALPKSRKNSLLVMVG